jgi:hypothetical protein
MVFNFDNYLKITDLQKTNAVVEDFLAIGGARNSSKGLIPPTK